MSCIMESVVKLREPTDVSDTLIIGQYIVLHTLANAETLHYISLGTAAMSRLQRL